MRPTRAIQPLHVNQAGHAVLLSLALLAVLCLGSACGPKEPAWTRPGATPLALDQDRADCRASATAMARADSFTGRDVLPETAWRVYLNCMAGRGWAAVSECLGPKAEAGAGSNARPGQCPPAPVFHDREMTPPDGFEPAERFRRDSGQITSCVYAHDGRNGARLRVEIQLAEAGFSRTAAPVEPSFVLVDRGRDELGAFSLDWAVAAGRRNGVDLAAFTAFVLAEDDKKRLAISLVTPLAGGWEAAPPGLLLPHAWREAALELARSWREWLAPRLAGR